MTLRQGRKVGRTLYELAGAEPSDDDVLVGVVDTPELAALIVAAVNQGDRLAAIEAVCKDAEAHVRLLSPFEVRAAARGDGDRPAACEFFIAPDALDEDTVWQSNGDRPLALIRECDLPREFWTFLATHIPRHSGEGDRPAEPHVPTLGTWSKTPDDMTAMFCRCGRRFDHPIHGGEAGA